jgi:hypothetical protein
MLAELRLLGPGDEGLLFSFLEPLIDTSVFLKWGFVLFA